MDRLCLPNARGVGCRVFSQLPTKRSGKNGLYEMVFFIAFAVVAVGFFVYVLIQFHRDSSSRGPRRR
jgi:hypothetical protein